MTGATSRLSLSSSNCPSRSGFGTSHIAVAVHRCSFSRSACSTFAVSRAPDVAVAPGSYRVPSSATGISLRGTAVRRRRAFVVLERTNLDLHRQPQRPRPVQLHHRRPVAPQLRDRAAQQHRISQPWIPDPRGQDRLRLRRPRWVLVPLPAALRTHPRTAAPRHQPRPHALLLHRRFTITQPVPVSRPPVPQRRADTARQLDQHFPDKRLQALHLAEGGRVAAHEPGGKRVGHLPGLRLEQLPSLLVLLHVIHSRSPIPCCSPAPRTSPTTPPRSRSPHGPRSPRRCPPRASAPHGSGSPGTRCRP